MYCIFKMWVSYYSTIFSGDNPAFVQSEQFLQLFSHISKSSAVTESEANLSHAIALQASCHWLMNGSSHTQSAKKNKNKNKNKKITTQQRTVYRNYSNRYERISFNKYTIPLLNI